MIPYNDKTGDAYEIKMFLALLSNKENFLPQNGTAYWANSTHYDEQDKAPLTIAGLKAHSGGFYKYTHVLWINKV